jgi:N-acetylglucosamine kinase-like BadF-type ATPase
MICIADGGSTKCDWVLVDTQGEVLESFQTRGLNPYFLSSDDIAKAMDADTATSSRFREAKKVFFYGAGVANVQLARTLRTGLEQVFTGAVVEVHHDVLGAALAVHEDESVIACILGTGSNACLFDGVKMQQAVPSLAHILGDEGSGSYLGKALLRGYFYKQLPLDLAKAFESEYKLTEDALIEHVYRQPYENVWLASFAPFFSKHRGEEWIEATLAQSFDDFLKIHVTAYPEHNTVKAGFVGSIAERFQDVLKQRCALLGIEVGKIAGRPIPELVKRITAGH